MKIPAESEELTKFINGILKIKAKIKKGSVTFRIVSNKEENLLRLQEELEKLFEINSKVNKLRKGIGIFYFELNINKKVQVKYLIDKYLMNSTEKEKWIMLQSKK